MNSYGIITIKDVNEISYKFGSDCDGVEKFYKGYFVVQSDYTHLESSIQLFKRGVGFWKDAEQNVMKAEHLKNQKELGDYLKNMFESTSKIAQLITVKAKSMKEVENCNVSCQFLMDVLISYLEYYFDQKNKCIISDGIYFNDNDKNYDNYVRFNIVNNLIRGVPAVYRKESTINERNDYWLKKFEIKGSDEWKEFNQPKTIINK